MECGGNSKARAYLKKIGEKKFDYKNTLATKYKTQLEKTVRICLGLDGGVEFSFEFIEKFYGVKWVFWDLCAIFMMVC